MVCCGVSCVEKLGAALLNQWCVVLRVEKLGAALLNQWCVVECHVLRNWVLLC